MMEEGALSVADDHWVYCGGCGSGWSSMELSDNPFKQKTEKKKNI